MKTSRGFTLIETLVAIAIMTLTISGPYFALSRALVASYIARDELTASALAQEGEEYVIGIRDNNFLGGRSWLTGLDQCRPGPCSLPPSQTDLTKFTRQVQITDVSATEVKVVVTVSWSTNGTQHSQVVTDYLTNWI